jgi:soluble lytic murein transglycosylase-like protein
MASTASTDRWSDSRPVSTDRRGRAGEWGLGQIKCPTARKVGFAGSCGQLADAAINLRYAMAYPRRALDRGGQGLRRRFPANQEGEDR